MSNAVEKQFELSRGSSHKPESWLSRSRVLVIVAILILLIIQRVGFEILGSGANGTTFLDTIAIFASCLAIGGCLAAALRGRGVSRKFWILFAAASALELVGNAGWAYYRYFNIAVPDSALFPSLFYRLEAAPMAIAMFLSDDVRPSKLGSFLDSCMVVGLVGVATYQLQMSELNAHDPKIWQLITMGTAVNVILALSGFVRFSLYPAGYLRGLFLRSAFYLSIYLAISFITSYVDAYLPGIDASVDLIWIVPSLAIAALALTWRPGPVEEGPQKQRISRRTALLCFNLTLATMVLGSAVLGLRLVNSTRVIGLIAVSAVLFAFAVRSAIMQDIQEKYLAALQESRKELERQALYDELTGLPNRRLLSERLAQIVAIAEREEHMMALFCLDLDGFKPVNDRLGHGVGDLLLRGVAQRMLTRVRKSDTLARLGGDEFIWVVAHIVGQDDAHRMAEEMLRSLSETYEIEGHAIAITASIGVSLYPDDASDAAALMQQADIAMYTVKHNGKNSVTRYSPGMGLA